MSETKAASSGKTARLSELFRYATFSDYCLLLIGFLGATGMGVLQPFLIFFLGEVFSEMGPDTSADDYYDSTKDLSLFMVYFGIAFMIFGLIAIATMVRVGARQGYAFRQAYFKKILYMDNAWYDAKAVAELPASIANDTLKIERASGDKLVIIIFTFMMILTALILAFINDIKLSLITMAFGPFVIFGLFLTNNGMEQNAKASDLSYKHSGGIAEEALQEVKTVAAFNAQKYEARKYTESLRTSRKAMLWNGMKVGTGMGLAICFMFVIMGVMYILGAQAIDNGDENWANGEELDVGNVMIVMFVSVFAFNNLATLVPAIRIVNEGCVAASHVLEALGTQPEIVGGSRSKEVKGQITFERVRFAYPTAPDTKILRSVSFEIGRGQRLGVVGSTGSGKSTIIQLLMRFYDPYSGQILIDGVDIREFGLKALRDSIGIVSQEPLLFNVSIYENIRYGRIEASESDIEAAAEQAGALEFIRKLPDGFQTLAGSKGSQLSGGQKQRIAIARAIIRNPKILLLDEATSALDRVTEQSVLASLDASLPECTRVAIAQNLLTIKESDHIIMLEHGKIIEEGDHRSLMKFKGKYYHLVKMQEIQQERTEDENADEASFHEVKGTDNNEVEVKSQEKGGAYMKKVLSLGKADRKWLLLGILGAVFVGVSYPLGGTFGGLQVNVLATKRGDELLEESIENSIYLFVVGVFVFIGLLFESIGFPTTSANMTTQLREKTFKNMLCFDAGFFDLPENNSSALTTRLARDCDLINGIGGSMFGLMIGIFTSLAVAHGVAAYFSWQMSLVALAIVPILLFSVSTVFLAQMKGLVEYSYNTSGTIASDSILNYKTIKAFNLEEVINERYLEPITAEFADTKKRGIMSGFTYGLGFGLIFLVYALLFWYGAKLFKDGDATFEDMIVAFITAVVGSDAFFLSGAYAGDMKAGTDAAKRIFALLEYEPVINIRNKAGEFTTVGGTIRFDDVTFAYPNRNYNALKNVSFRIEQGSKFAIIGRTGSGKSTIVQLLQRLYDPASGSISINSTPLTAFNLKHLRNSIGIVSQEPVLFSGTIAENISYNIELSGKEIERAAELAEATEFISQNKRGFDRQVGFKGSKLSGGQKQRIAIARAIVRHPSILIFDEATSALDSETESRVIANMNQELGECTWIMVAHRLKTISEADTILVMESGRILEYGPKQELYNQGGYYYNMISNL